MDQISAPAELESELGAVTIIIKGIEEHLENLRDLTVELAAVTLRAVIMLKRTNLEGLRCCCSIVPAVWTAPKLEQASIATIVPQPVKP